MLWLMSHPVFHVAVSPAWEAAASPHTHHPHKGKFWQGGGGNLKLRFALACKCVMAYFDRVSGVHEVFLTFFETFAPTDEFESFFSRFFS